MKSILFFCLLTILPLSATNIERGKVPLLEPFQGLEVYMLPGENVFPLLDNCEIDRNKYVQYWQPSKQQVEIIDKRLNVALNERGIVVSPKIVQKLYFGLGDDSSNEKVFIFLYTGLKEDITIDVGNEKFSCLRVMTKAEFDLDTLAFTFLD